MSEPRVTRRDLLKVGALSTVGLAASAGALLLQAPEVQATPGPGIGSGERGREAAGHDSHEAGNTVGDLQPAGFDPSTYLTSFNSGRVSRLPTGQVLREYELVAVDREIEVAPGLFFPAWTYNGQVPGPTLRCTEGDRVRVHFSNAGSHAHTVHFHGFHPSTMDGVFEPVAPGQEYTYEFDAEPFGLHLYHCHTVPIKRHIHKGLYGVFLIDPPGGRPPARELVMMMNGFDTNFDGENEVYAVNTVAFHYMKHPIPLRVGELTRIYLVNITEFDPINSLHSHGNFFRAYRTGTDLDRHEWTDVVTLAQGERAVLEFAYKHPGRFMFHAHQSEFAELGWSGTFNVQGLNA